MAAAAVAAAMVAAARAADTCGRNPFHLFAAPGRRPNRPAAPQSTGSNSRLPSSCNYSVTPVAVAMEGEKEAEMRVEVEGSLGAGEEKGVEAWAGGRAEAAEVAEGKAEAAEVVVARAEAAGRAVAE